MSLWSDFMDIKGQSKLVNSCPKQYLEEHGENCITCANSLSESGSIFIGCELKMKDFTYSDEVIRCQYYEFKGFIEEEQE